jgi:hypothetical protein
MIKYKYNVGDMVYKHDQFIVTGPHRIVERYNGDNCCDIYVDKLAFYATDDSPKMCHSEDYLFWSKEDAIADANRHETMRAKWRENGLRAMPRNEEKQTV